MEPGARSRSEAPWVFFWRWKPWRLMPPAKPRPFHGAGDIDDLADCKNVSLDHVAFFVGVFLDAGFFEVLHRRHAFDAAALGMLVIGLEDAKMTLFASRKLLCLHVAKAELDGIVAIIVNGLDLCHKIGAGLNDRHPCGVTLLVEELGHAHFSSNYLLHDSLALAAFRPPRRSPLIVGGSIALERDLLIGS